jgi:tellurium resistance protein TerD
MFDIPISNNVKPALGLDALASGGLNSGSQPAPQNNGFNQPMSQPMAQPAPQPMAQPMSAPMNNGMQNNGFGQPAPQPMAQPMQNNGYQQPMSNPQPMAQPMAQPMQPAQPMGGTPAFSSTPRPNGGGVVLAKGQKVSLSKMSANLDLIEVGLGWDTATNSAIPYDLDAEAFMLGENGKVIGDDWFIFYNQPMSPDGSCKHSGDNKDGSGVGDDEVIQLQLSRVNPQVAKIAFVISINEAQARGHNFGGVQNAYVRVVDKGTGKELIKFNLTDYFKEVTSMTVGELYLKGGEWRFNAVGQGLNTDLAGLCGFYGVNLA